MNRPWMPLYVGDYLGDTGHLTTAQHGAYLLLMMHYWRKCELPDDDRQLCKIAKLPLKTWCEYRATLQDFFYEGWKHKRINAELARMMRVSEKTRDRRPERRHRFGAGADEAGEWRAVPTRPVPGNCRAIVQPGRSQRQPLTPIPESFQGGGEYCRSTEAAAGSACATAGDPRQRRAGGLCR
jgi:uncharacterized protein YdaU (DUF1376 family)